MKQVVQNYRTGEIRLADVAAPACKAGGVLVQNRVSAVSAGTEKLMIELGRKSLVGKAVARPDLVRKAYEKARKEGFVGVFREALSRLDEPVPLGYSSAGVVVEAGRGVQGLLREGDRVACAGAGFASHAEYVWVPKNLCVKLPDGVSFEEASFVMIGSIAMHGVRCAAATPGECVAVVGLGLIGLITAQIMAAYGYRVVGCDVSEEKNRRALGLGAAAAVAPGLLAGTAQQMTQGRGADAVVVCAAAADSAPLVVAEEAARKGARVVLVGMADLRLTRKSFWEKELTFIVSKAAGPGSVEDAYEKEGLDIPAQHARWTEGRNMEEFVRLVGEKKVDVAGLVTHRFPIGEAARAYELVTKGREPFIGVVFEYGGEVTAPGAEARRATGAPRRAGAPDAPAGRGAPGGRRGIGFIGGGLFTKNILLPALMRTDRGRFSLVGVATTRGITGAHLAAKFGFGYSTTDYRRILEDPQADSVFVTTQHDTHARLVAEALAAGKRVFVEKPLAIDEEGLAAVEEACRAAAARGEGPVLAVGFNRRHSPLARELRRFVATRTTPLVVHYRVNAGYVPPEHWVQRERVGGGRIVGEGCHFIDFMQFLAGADPVSVYAQGIGGSAGKYLAADNAAVTVELADGSVGSLLYTAMGTKSFSRERVEVYCEEGVGVIEDWRRLELRREGASRTIARLSMDMGYTGELAAFLAAGEDPALVAAAVRTTRATLRARESLEQGRKLPVG